MAKQLSAGMQTETIDDKIKDCGTDKTLNVLITEKNHLNYVNRNIKVNGKPMLLTTDNIKNYMGKIVHMYSPMFCIGKHICLKCAGGYNNKFIGLDTSKVATTLTNLNMKKFHNNVIKSSVIDPDDLLMKDKNKGIFGTKKNSIVLNTDYCEIYIPYYYFDKNYRFSEEMGNQIKTFGILPVGIFNGNSLKEMDTLKLPTWVTIHAINTEMRKVNIPGEGEIPCKVIKYHKGNELFANSIIIDSEKSQTYLRFITFGKIPNTVPYSKALELWIKNQEMNDVNFGVPSIVLEVILSVMYRSKKNNAIKFATEIGNPNYKGTEHDYVMGSIRDICRYTSTFTAITFEDIDSMITASINRGREKKQESYSPVEELFVM